MTALTINHLDRMMCGSLGCDHTSHDGLYLHPRCHTGQGVEVLYRFGQLEIACRVCKAKVCNVKVSA